MNAFAARFPRFDVVIPCYNYGRFLAEAVGSALSQNVDIRVLVIDDASSDDTSEIGQTLARADSRVTFRRHAVNRGHIETYNEGIAWAEGDFFVLLSADDLLMPGGLSLVAAAFAKKPEAVMAFGRAIYFEDGLPVQSVLDRSVKVRSSKHPCLALHVVADSVWDGIASRPIERSAREEPTVLDTAAFFKLNRSANRLHACSVVTRTAIQRQLGGYLPSLPHSGDYEMWLRFAAHGSVVYLPRFLGAARLHRTNMSRAYDPVSDVLQRAKAIHELEASCGARVPAQLLKHMRVQLGKDALRATSIAMEHRASVEQKQLVETAKALDPAIRWRWVWWLYLLKVTLGPRIWGLVRRRLLLRAPT